MGTGQQIATGNHGTLRASSARAFIDALAFAQTFLTGEQVTLTENDYQQYTQAMAQHYASLDQDSQIVLARFDEIWATATQQWQTASQDDRNGFVYLVFVLGYGREQVDAWITEAGGTVPGQSPDTGDCEGDVATCVAQACGTADCYETLNDIDNNMSCWASAGCSDYDSESNTYTYDDYSSDSY